MEIDKDLSEMLQTISPDPKPLIIKTLIEEFIYELMWTGENVNVPLPFDKYRECLLEGQHSFICYLSKEHIGFLDELGIGDIWDYRYFLDTKFDPHKRTIYVIAVRMFMKFCYQKGCLDIEISDNMQLVKDNRMYICDMDPLAVDIFDIL